MKTKVYRIFLFAFLGLIVIYTLIQIGHYSYLFTKEWNRRPDVFSVLLWQTIQFVIVGVSLGFALFKRRLVSLLLSALPTVMLSVLLLSPNTTIKSGIAMGPHYTFDFVFSIIDITFTSLILAGLIAHITLLIIGIINQRKSPDTSA